MNGCIGSFAVVNYKSEFHVGLGRLSSIAQGGGASVARIAVDFILCHRG